MALALTTNSAEIATNNSEAINQHVPAILSGTKPPKISDSGYVTMGGADEATEYVNNCGPVSRQTPGAVAWLNRLVETLPKKPTSSKDIH